MIVDKERLELLKMCSGDLWNTFKYVCGKDFPDKEEHMEYALNVFKDTYGKYRDTCVRAYAIQYSHDLLNEIERLLYSGKLVKSDYQEVKRMEYKDFCEYLKSPNTGDLITVTNDSNDDLVRVKIWSVIKQDE